MSFTEKKKIRKKPETTHKIFFYVKLIYIYIFHIFVQLVLDDPNIFVRSCLYFSKFVDKL